MSGIELSRTLDRVDWWTANTQGETLERAIAAYQSLVSADTGRREMLARHARMYGNTPVTSNGITRYDLTANDDRIRLNIVKAVVDTVSAKITKNHPKPEPLTTNGNWSMRRRARYLDWFLQAQFSISRVPEQMALAFKDAASTGTGCAKAYLRDDKIQFERVYPGEVFVDELDGLYSDPTTVYQRKLMDRRVLAARYPKHKTAIAQAGILDPSDNEANESGKEGGVVEVVMAWRRASSEKEKDGRYIMFVEGALLEDAEQDYYLPFVFIRWTSRLRGFWGIGLAEELTGIQVEINRLIQKIQSSMHLVSVPRVFVEEGSRVQQSYMSNQIGVIIPYRGTPPQVVVPQSVHPEMFNHLNWLWQRGFELSGVSQMNAGSARPPELSGQALNTYHDIETERFATVGQVWEQAHLDVAKLFVSLAKKANLTVSTRPDRYSLERVPWSDIDLDRDAYTLTVGPASDLPTTPAGRIAAVQTLVNAQLVDPQTGARLLDFQDVDREMSLDRAAADNLDRIFETMLDTGEYLPPEPYMDLKLALKKGQAELHRAEQYEDIPEERLELLRQFLRGCHQMLKAAMAEQAALQSPPMAGAPLPPGSSGQSPTAVTSQDGAMTSV